MIHYTNSLLPTAGKGEQATKWLLKFAKYANEAYGKYGHHVEVTRSLDGVGMMHWLHVCPSLSAFDEALRMWRADEKVRVLEKEGEGLFGPGESHFLEVVEG